MESGRLRRRNAAGVATTRPSGKSGGELGSVFAFCGGRLASVTPALLLVRVNERVGFGHVAGESTTIAETALE